MSDVSNQFYLFVGENDYARLAERKRWIDEFSAKHGEENVLKAPVNISYTELSDALCTTPFLAEKRLVLLDGVPKMEKEQFETLLSDIHPDILFVLVVQKVDKRTALAKYLLSAATVKEFPFYKEKQLLGWAQHTAQQYGGELSQGTAEFLIQYVGTDQFALENEIHKLVLAEPRGAEKEEVEKFCCASSERIAWGLLDLIAAGKKTAAVQEFEQLLQTGEQAHGLWARMQWLLSSIVSVWTVVQEGQGNPAAIAKVAGVPFPTVRSVLPLCKKLSKEDIGLIVEKTLQIDTALKTGGLRTTVDSIEELTASVDSLLMKLPLSR